MTLRISVVIPTLKRAEQLKACLKSLESQTLLASDFEVLVVIDETNNSEYDWLGNYSPPYNLQSFSQDHQGLSAARNFGNDKAKSEIILSLDDDMIASSELLEKHLEAQENIGTGWVQGSLLIHDSISRTPYIRYEEKRRQKFHQSKIAHDGKIAPQDVSGGNFSLPKKVLEKVGGFNPHPLINADTDGELAWQVDQLEIPFLYAPEASTQMCDVKDFKGNMERSFQSGKSYVFQAKQYPKSKWRHSPLVNDSGSSLRNIFRRYYFSRSEKKWFGPSFESFLNIIKIIAESSHLSVFMSCVYRLSFDYSFWKGVHDQSDGSMLEFLPLPVPVLSYHNVSNVSYPGFRNYVLPVKEFEWQIHWLKRNGYTAITLDQLYEYFIGRGDLPEKPVVITFDDGFEELTQNAIPLLAEMKMPHVIFVTTGKLDDVSDWIENAPNVPILRTESIKNVIEKFGDYTDFQAHGKDHLTCETLNEKELECEVKHSIETLEALTARKVKYFAYPFGEYNVETPKYMKRLPIRCAFTVARGLCRPGQPLFLLPRVEVFTIELRLDFVRKMKRGKKLFENLRRRIRRPITKLMRKLTGK